MTKPYEELRAEVNRRNPERLKLEEGCEVRVGLNKWIHTIYGYDTDEKYPWLAYLNKPFPQGLQANDFYSACFESGTDVEILGKPLELRDVLRAMKKIAPEKGDDFPIGFDYHGRISNCDVDCKNLTQTDIGLNLAVPLSHPDNSEACEKLLALLTNKGI